MLFFTPLMKDVHNKTFKIIFKNYLTLISWSFIRGYLAFTYNIYY